MNRMRLYEPDSPLREILESLPEETPPADLESRCVSALHEARATCRPARLAWFGSLEHVASVAVVLLALLSMTASCSRCSLEPGRRGIRRRCGFRWGCGRRGAQGPAVTTPRRARRRRDVRWTPSRRLRLSRGH